MTDYQEHLRNRKIFWDMNKFDVAAALVRGYSKIAYHKAGVGREAVSWLTSPGAQATTFAEAREAHDRGDRLKEHAERLQEKADRLHARAEAKILRLLQPPEAI